MAGRFDSGAPRGVVGVLRAVLRQALRRITPDIGPSRLASWNQIFGSSGFIIFCYLLLTFCIAGALFAKNGVYLLLIGNPAYGLGQYFDHPVFWTQILSAPLLLFALLHRDLMVSVRREKRFHSFFYVTWVVALWPTLAMVVAIATRTTFLDGPADPLGVALCDAVGAWTALTGGEGCGARAGLPLRLLLALALMGAAFAVGHFAAELIGWRAPAIQAASAPPQRNRNLRVSNFMAIAVGGFLAVELAIGGFVTDELRARETDAASFDPVYAFVTVFALALMYMISVAYFFERRLEAVAKRRRVRIWPLAGAVVLLLGVHLAALLWGLHALSGEGAGLHPHLVWLGLLLINVCVMAVATLAIKMASRAFFIFVLAGDTDRGFDSFTSRTPDREKGLLSVDAALGCFTVAAIAVFLVVTVLATGYANVELISLFLAAAMLSLFAVGLKPLEKLLAYGAVLIVISFAAGAAGFRYEIPNLTYLPPEGASAMGPTLSVALLAAAALLAMRRWISRRPLISAALLAVAGGGVAVVNPELEPIPLEPLLRAEPAGSRVVTTLSEEAFVTAATGPWPPTAAASRRSLTLQDAWPARGEARGEPIVMMAFSGGGYRSTYWSALVLDALARNAPGFLSDRVKLMTGASGGMIAASYAYALAAGESACPPGTERSVRNAFLIDVLGSTDRHDAIAGFVEDAEARPADCFPAEAGYLGALALPDLPEPSFEGHVYVDSMATLLQGLNRDFLHLFYPVTVAQERGLDLEAHWPTLARSFDAFMPRERAGAAPSLVFAPTALDHGRPVFFSNFAWRLTNEADVAAVPGAARRTAEKVNPYHFFHAFPEAKPALTLATMARLSATFPFVLPALDLPTDPPISLGDAGYFENFGVDTIAEILLSREGQDRFLGPAIADDPVRAGADIVLIEIRAFPQLYNRDDDAARGERATQCWSGPSDPAGKPAGFDFLLSPLIGARSVYDHSMDLRRERQLQDLKAVYRGGRLKHFVFENYTSTSLSWALQPHEMACMERELRLCANRRALAEIANLLAPPGAPPIEIACPETE